MILITVGLYLPYRILELIITNWNDENAYKRETARMFGGLVIFYLYYQLWRQGLKCTYESESCGSQFLGHLLLLIATVGLFLPFRIIQLICNNWNNEVKWKK